MALDDNCSAKDLFLCSPNVTGQSVVLDKDGGGGKDLSPQERVGYDTDESLWNSILKSMENKSKPPMTAEQRRFEDLMTYFVNNASPNADFLKAPDPPIPAGECRYCLKVDDHITQLCPYKYDVPKNAILGKGCSVQCVVCGCRFRDSCCAKCGHTRGRAILMDCRICGKSYDHWPDMCPQRDLNSSFTCDPYTSYISFKTCPPKE
ncbi:PREDICTED: LOC110753416 isoform [Prunus dulcis]|uniref:PREDICTED: LOC110753416 isoform n=1 Tax=Prunus dulcis TaxID=3755 RepID=A0A5E4EAK1_PRUDU|nr:PREDICTED: LOC110753416 isoform [Prunus dulcis]